MDIRTIVFVMLLVILAILSAIYPEHWEWLLLALVIIALGYVFSHPKFWKWEEKRVKEDRELDRVEYQR